MTELAKKDVQERFATLTDRERHAVERLLVLRIELSLATFSFR